MLSHLSIDLPAGGRVAAGDAGGNGREVRPPMPQQPRHALHAPAQRRLWRTQGLEHARTCARPRRRRALKLWALRTTEASAVDAVSLNSHGSRDGMCWTRWRTHHRCSVIIVGGCWAARFCAVGGGAVQACHARRQLQHVRDPSRLHGTGHTRDAGLYCQHSQDGMNHAVRCIVIADAKLRKAAIVARRRRVQHSVESRTGIGSPYR